MGCAVIQTMTSLHSFTHTYEYLEVQKDFIKMLQSFFGGKPVVSRSHQRRPCRATWARRSPDVLAVYVHSIDPHAVHLWGPVSIRWYGLSYLVGFFLAFFLIRRVTRVGVSTQTNSKLIPLAILLAKEACKAMHGALPGDVRTESLCYVLERRRR